MLKRPDALENNAGSMIHVAIARVADSMFSTYHQHPYDVINQIIIGLMGETSAMMTAYHDLQHNTKSDPTALAYRLIDTLLAWQAENTPAN